MVTYSTNVVVTYRDHICQTVSLAAGGSSGVLIIIQANLAHIGGALREGPFTGSCRGVGGGVSRVPGSKYNKINFPFANKT